MAPQVVSEAQILSIGEVTREHARRPLAIRTPRVLSVPASRRSRTSSAACKISLTCRGNLAAPACRTCIPPSGEYILQPMKALLVEVDDDLAVRLERVAPARSRRRSEFVRAAILKALWEAEEQATAEAYARQPDSPDVPLDPTVWEARGARAKR